MSTKWSAFSAGSALSGSDQVVGLQGGANVRWTATQLQTFVLTGNITSFNTRTGAVTLSSGDVTTALGFTPAGLVANTFTGVQTLPAGAVGAPSLTWGDSTTGFYRPSANTLALAVSGVSKLDYGVSSGGSWTMPTTLTISAGGLNVLGNAFIQISNAGGIFWATRSTIYSDADGSIRLTNNASNAFTSLQFGGTSSSFPAMKRSSTVLQARLADDSAFAPLQGNLRTQANAVAETPTATHTMIITDAGGTAYRVLCVV